PDPRNLVPAPGYYKTSLTRNGVDVPVWVWETGERDQDGEPMEDIILHIAVNNVETTADKVWGQAERVALWATEIDEAEYRYMIDDADHCEKYAPDDAKARPYEPIDLTKMRPITPGG
ncbi:hypothetical protein LCGC14_1839780, partial [marine sediment metagenome]